MIELFKDRYKLGLVLATLFIVGIVASLYQIYRLPHNLMLGSDYHPALFNVYVVLGITFLIGGFSLWWTLNNQNEVIVFRDKQVENSTGTKEGSESGQTTISLESVKDSIKQSVDEKELLKSGLQAVCKQLDAGQGAIYRVNPADKKVELKSGYALSIGESTIISYELGEGLIGQTAASGKTLYLDDIPEGYVKIVSGLGSASPRYLLIVPIKQQENVLGALEIASFSPISNDQQKFVEESAQLMADKISGKKS